MIQVAGTPARRPRRFVRSRLWRCAAVLGLLGGLLWGAQPAGASTMFCHGYASYTDARSGATVHVKTCITYWMNGSTYNVRATTYSYLTDRVAGIDLVHVSAKLELPLGTVRYSRGCLVDPPVGFADAAVCSVTYGDASNPPSWFSTGRASLFYADGQFTLGRKICQTGLGPDASPSGWC